MERFDVVWRHRHLGCAPRNVKPNIFDFVTLHYWQHLQFVLLHFNERFDARFSEHFGTFSRVTCILICTTTSTSCVASGDVSPQNTTATSDHVYKYSPGRPITYYPLPGVETRRRYSFGGVPVHCWFHLVDLLG